MTIHLISIRLYTRRKSTKMRIFNTPSLLSPPKITMNVSTTYSLFITTGKDINNPPCECLCMWVPDNSGRGGNTYTRQKPSHQLEAYSRWKNKSDQIGQSDSFLRAILKRPKPLSFSRPHVIYCVSLFYIEWQSKKLNSEIHGILKPSCGKNVTF